MALIEEGQSDNCYCDEAGKALIRYNIPEPPKVKYRWEGEPWKTILSENGIDYRLETEIPFSGGQCVGVEYNVTVSTNREVFNRFTGAKQYDVPETRTYNRIRGAIQGLAVVQNPAYPFRFEEIHILTSFGSVRTEMLYNQDYTTGEKRDRGFYKQITNLVRSDGVIEYKDPLFRGGQCPDVAYEVKFAYYTLSGSSTLQGTIFYNRFFYGPITIELPYGNNTRTPNDDVQDMIIIQGAPKPPGGQYFTYERYVIQARGLYHFGYTHPLKQLSGYSYRGAYNTLAKGVEIIRKDGQADNCGDPPVTSCGDPEGDCTLTIFEPGDPEVILYEETRSRCPDVEKFPCTINPINERTITVELSRVPVFWLPGVFGILNEVNECIYAIELYNPLEQQYYVGFLKVVNLEIEIGIPLAKIAKYLLRKRYPEALSWLEPFLSITLAEFDVFILPIFEEIGFLISPPGCPPPQWFIECNPGECPDGTAYQCEDNGVICCFDEECNLLTTI